MSKKQNRQQTGRLDCIRPNAAGIDIASQMHYVAIPEGRDTVKVRKFGAFTEDLHEMARWLKSCGIDTVAMESTGVYWVQAYLILEEYDFDVFLVNARHLKNVSGRKSDVEDSQWIQQLHSYGLLEKSFQPESLTRELRSYMRQRKNLTRGYASQVQLMQKAFDQMNIKLHNVLSDITGKSGMAIIKAILAGQRDAELLAELADKGVKASRQEIVKSLQGIWREDNLFELKQAYELYEIYLEKIAACDLQIESVLNRMLESTGRQMDKTKRGPVSGKNKFRFNAATYLTSITGVRLTDIFGISELSVAEILSETGTDMSKWTTEKHFTSWLNLAPNTRISGGKNLKSKPSRKKNHAGQAFLLAASTLKASNNWLGEFYRRIKAKSGAPTAIKATARKLAVIFYRMLRDKKEFTPLPLDEYNNYFKERKIKYFDKQAAKYGFRLIPVDTVS
jgi:transposase